MTTAPRTLKAAFWSEPLRIAADQPHQVLISTLSVTLTGQFFASGDVVSTPVAVVAAVGVEYAYLKGLSDAGYTGSIWGGRLIWTAFSILAIAGTSVLLKDVYHAAWLTSPSPFFAVVLSLLHILPIALLGLCSAKLHAEADDLRQQQIRARAEEGIRKERDRGEWEEQLERRQREQRAEIEGEKARRLMDIETRVQAQQIRAAVAAAASQERHATVTEIPSQGRHAASQSSRDAFKQAVIAAFCDDPNFNRQSLADAHGWSRAMVNKLIREAQAEGLLPKQEA